MNITVGECGQLTGVNGRTLARLFYDRVLDADRCPVVSGRRQIPIEYVPAIRLELERRGLIRREHRQPVPA